VVTVFGMKDIALRADGDLMEASAVEGQCSVLWTEDFQDGRKFANLTVRNQFTGI
jgi:predicted nucleic acid-binding protein